MNDQSRHLNNYKKQMIKTINVEAKITQQLMLCIKNIAIGYDRD